MRNIDARLFRWFSTTLQTIAGFVLVATFLLPSGIVQRSNAPVMYQGGSATSSVTPHFIAPSGSSTGNATEFAVQVPTPSATIHGMYVFLAVAPGTGSSATFTWRDNGSSESLSCTISDTAQTCSDTTDSFIAAQGDLLDIQVTVSGAVSSLVIAETAVFSVS